MRISDWSSDVCSSDLEQRAEERAEEHHLGEDEPHHPHPERAVDLLVVVAGDRFEDHVGEPLEQDHDHPGDADEEHRLAVAVLRSEEHTSELQSLMRISYAVFCLKKKKTKHMPQ